MSGETLSIPTKVETERKPRAPRKALIHLIAVEAWGLLLLAIGIVYILGLSGAGGPAGLLLVRATLPLIGVVGSWVLALAIVAGTVHLLAAARLPLAGRITKYLFISLPLIIGAYECALHLGRFYWDEEARKATGYLGLWIGRLLRLLVGDSGLPVALVLLAVIAFLVLRISPRSVFTGLWQMIARSLGRRK